MTKIADYVNETRQELKHVSWPTRKQAVSFTLIVIALSVLVSVFLGIVDFIFSNILSGIIH